MFDHAASYASPRGSLSGSRRFFGRQSAPADESRNCRQGADGRADCGTRRSQLRRTVAPSGRESAEAAGLADCDLQIAKSGLGSYSPLIREPVEPAARAAYFVRIASFPFAREPTAFFEA